MERRLLVTRLRSVGIGYGTPWRQVEAMLRMAARRTPGLLATPEPFVLQKALGDFGVTYELNAYCDQPQAMGRTYTALHQNILNVFNEYGDHDAGVRGRYRTAQGGAEGALVRARRSVRPHRYGAGGTPRGLRPALQPGAGNAFQPRAAAKATGGRLAPPPRRR
jgi:Mechanosensitive ion channel